MDKNRNNKKGVPGEGTTDMNRDINRGDEGTQGNRNAERDVERQQPHRQGDTMGNQRPQGLPKREGEVEEEEEDTGNLNEEDRGRRVE